MTSVLGRETARPITPHSILVAQLQQTLKLAQENNIPVEILDSLRQGVQLAAGLDPYLDDYTTPESNAVNALDSGVV